MKGLFNSGTQRERESIRDLINIISANNGEQEILQAHQMFPYVIWANILGCPNFEFWTKLSKQDL